MTGDDARRRARALARTRQRGSVAVLFALLLTVLVGVLALVLDVGHFWEVRAELQNSADSSALAGALSLNGTAAQFPVATGAAQYFARQNDANSAPVNVPLSDVVLGHWNVQASTFAPATALMPPPQVNAVRVTTRRTAATGDAVRTFFAPVIGINQQDITATAIAVGGGPASTCGFPVAVPQCELFDGQGNLTCDTTMTLIFNSNQNNAAFTLLTLTNPNNPAIECAFARALASSACPNGCNCSGSCIPTNVNDSIRIQNGNDLPDPAVGYVKQAVGPPNPPVYVQIPVIDTGLPPGCAGPGSGALSGIHDVVGYVEVQLLDASGPPNKSLTVRIDCSRSTNSPAGGGFFGYTSTQVYLGQ
jgi:Flp pilus assembly protein TadG